MATKKTDTIDFDSYSADFGKDFRDVVDDVEGWIKPFEGLLVHGILKGMKYDPSKEKFFFIVELKRECRAITGAGKEAQAITLQPGQHVGLTERYKLMVLRDYVINQGEFILQFGEKENLKGGRTMWKIAGLKVRGETATYKPPIPAEEPF